MKTDYCDGEKGVRIRSEGSIRDTAIPIAKRVAVALAASLLASCGSVERAYWDAKVEEMCRKDAGVTVYERVKITRDEYKRLGGTDGSVPVPPRQVARPGYPYVTEYKTTPLNDNPEVFRSDVSIVRTEDGKVLSRLVQYARVGRDFIRPFSCQDLGIREDIRQQTFMIVGD